jgi:hypothetical protein
MRVLAIVWLLAVAGCTQEPEYYPTLDTKYEGCLVAEMRRRGYSYEMVDAPTYEARPPTAWPSTKRAILWRPPSKDAEIRLWCEVAFCYADTRDTTKGAFPDICERYQ